MIGDGSERICADGGDDEDVNPCDDIARSAGAVRRWRGGAHGNTTRDISRR
jgi:hypothetical protein